jgi:hypothetical protein
MKTSISCSGSQNKRQKKGDDEHIIPDRGIPKSRMCSRCGRQLLKDKFSKTQWKDKTASTSTCIECNQLLDTQEGIVLKRNHAMSLGLVDGAKHLVPGNVRYDRAIRSNVADKEAATKIMDDFLEKFNAETVCISGIARLNYDPESYLNFNQMHVAEYREPTINKSYFGDFMTTIRSPAVAHKKFMKKPQTSGEWKIGEFHDSPSMTKGSALKFLCTKSATQYISSFPADCIVKHDRGGTVLLHENKDILVGARCSDSLPPKVMIELKNVYDEMERCRAFLKRGDGVANVCAFFAVTGLKEDLNTKVSMTHVHKKEALGVPEQEMRAKLRSIFKKHIYPIVKKEFGWLFEPIIDWLNANEVEMYALSVTGVTAGKLFWPRSHTDPDAWYTILVCLDYGNGILGGGDFSFVSVGNILECRSGDVLIYNPTIHHGTTEFDLHENDVSSGRIFFAFFMKKAVAKARLLSKILLGRVGTQPLVFKEDEL